MRIALGRGREALLAGAGGVLTGAAVLASAGSSDDRLVWIGGGAVVVAAFAGAAAVTGLLRVPRLELSGLLFVSLFTAFVVWNGLSVVWSIAPDLSWGYFNRGLSYLAFLAVGLFIGANVRGAVRLAAIGLAVFVGAAVGWALGAKMFPALGSDSDRLARLHTPIGYWNAMALLVVMGVPAALWFASRREHGHAVRTAGTLLLYGSTTALLLTYSRGGILAGILVVVLWIALVTPRLESVAAVVIGGVPGAAVALWTFTRAGLSKDLQPHSARVHDGARFALVFCVVGVAVAAAAFWASRYERRRPLPEALRRKLARAAWGALAVGVAGGAIWLAFNAHPSGWLDEFTKRPSVNVTQTPQRLTTLSSTSRWQWWSEAWHAWKDRPVLGTGAASFVLTDHILRPENTFVTEPHSLPIQFLTETGIVGLLLFLGAAFAAAVAVVRRLRGLAGDARAPATALALAALAYFLHGLIDFDWDFVAVTAPLMVVLGVLVAPGVERGRGRLGALWAFACVAVASFALYSLAAPWLSRRDTNDALTNIDRGRADQAVTIARRAHDLEPLALEPLYAWAAAEEERSNPAAARRVYVQAVELQPLNWRTWYELGNFEFVHKRPRVALAYLERAAALDPHGPQAAPLRDFVKQQLGQS